jgi:eukaryotic-like serine/threonine-protein kinase
VAGGQRGRVLAGRYELRERLGHGGAGTVWRGYDRALDRAVAVKLLHADLAEDRDAATRFRTEATAAAKLTHPNAVLVYDLGRDGDDDYLVMELVEGVDLAALVREGALPAGLAAGTGSQVAAALGAAHQAGIVHRDVKPGNVLLTSEGTAKLADFGIARALGAATARLTRTGTVLGTARYLAPEQLRDDPVDARADVYALGLVLHEVLTGRPPFGEGNAIEVAARRLTTSLPAIDELVDGVPGGLVDVIEWCTRLDPSERPEDGTELAAALRRFATVDATPALARRIATVPQRTTTPVTSDPLTPPSPASPPAAAPASSGAPSSAAPATPSPPVPPPAGATRRIETPPSTPPRDTTRALPTTDEHPRQRDEEARRRNEEARRRDEQARRRDEEARRRDADRRDGRDRRTPTAVAAPAPRAAGPARTPAPPKRGSGGRRLLLLAVVAIVALSVIVVGLNVAGDDVPTAGDDDGVTAPTADEDDAGADEAGEAVAVAEAGDHDPQGDLQERGGDVGNAVDGDLETFWPTETYTTADFGGLGKDGVGIWLELEEQTALDRVELELGAEGGAVELWASEDGPPAPEVVPGDWGSRLGSGPVPGDRLRFPDLGGAEVRTLLVWFTELPAAGSGFRAEVRQVRVYAE